MNEIQQIYNLIITGIMIFLGIIIGLGLIIFIMFILVYFGIAAVNHFIGYEYLVWTG